MSYLESLVRVAETRGVGREELLQGIQGKHLGYIREGKFSSSKKLGELTGVEPEIPNKEVQGIYEHYLTLGVSCSDHSPFRSIKTLEELTGVGPVFSREVVLKAYETLVNSYPYCDGNSTRESVFESINGLEQMTGVPFSVSEEVIQDAYRRTVERFRGPQNCLELAEIIGIEPVVPEKIARSVIDGSLDVEHIDFEQVSYLHRFRGGEVFEGIIEEKQREFLESHQLDDLGISIQKSGKCFIPEKEIQASYLKFLKERDPGSLVMYWEGIGVKPKISEKDVRRIFMPRLKRGSLHSHDLKNLRKLGANIPEDIIRGVHMYEAKSYALCDLKSLEKETGLEVSDDVYGVIVDSFIGK